MFLIRRDGHEDRVPVHNSRAKETMPDLQADLLRSSDVAGHVPDAADEVALPSRQAFSVQKAGCVASYGSRPLAAFEASMPQLVVQALGRVDELHGIVLCGSAHPHSLLVRQLRCAEQLPPEEEVVQSWHESPTAPNLSFDSARYATRHFER